MRGVQLRCGQNSGVDGFGADASARSNVCCPSSPTPARVAANNVAGAWRGQRLFDLSFSLCAAILLAPIFAIVALSVLLVLGRPVLFRQERLGVGGAAFTLLKFRSMSEDRDADGDLRPDRQRLGPFGRWLRATHLDELPQVFNILAGHMSVVGPRPLVSSEQIASNCGRLRVRPGLTGWAQVMGTRTLPIADKSQLDATYISNASLALDLKIIAMTLPSIVRSRITERSKMASVIANQTIGKAVADTPITPDSRKAG